VEGLIAWCGFAGAWLLFAGPVYQAALELREYDEAQEAIATASRSVPPPNRPSPLWWLIPPVGYILQRRAAGQYRQAVTAALSAEDREVMVEFSNKAMGWLLVAAGALLIAVKETWELREHYEWSVAVFWVLVVVMPVLGASYTALRIRAAQGMLSAGG
jgi:hypothetical protein